MLTENEDLAIKIAIAKEVYQQYVKNQAGVELPQAKITIEKTNEDRTEVFIDVTYKDNNYHFRSFKESDAKDFDTYLNSQPLVRGKYASGKTVAFEATQQRAKQFSDRFNPKLATGLHLYSGFVVTDVDTETFLGIANLGASGKNDGHAEMAFLNRPEAWSAATPEIVREYAIEQPLKLGKSYQGLGTVEVSTLLQFSAELKQKGYQIQGKDLVGVNATARLDNPGSWKSLAKSGMEVIDVDVNPDYGPELRYQLRKSI